MSQYQTMSSYNITNIKENFTFYDSYYKKYYDLNSFIQDKITQDNIDKYILENSEELQILLNKYPSITISTNSITQNARLVLEELNKNNNSDIITLTLALNDINNQLFNISNTSSLTPGTSSPDLKLLLLQEKQQLENQIQSLNETITGDAKHIFVLYNTLIGLEQWKNINTQEQKTIAMIPRTRPKFNFSQNIFGNITTQPYL